MVTLLMIWALLNVAELLLCGADKFYAKTGRWRIPEKVLLGLGLVAVAFFRPEPLVEPQGAEPSHGG